MERVGRRAGRRARQVRYGKVLNNQPVRDQHSRWLSDDEWRKRWEQVGGAAQRVWINDEPVSLHKKKISPKEATLHTFLADKSKQTNKPEERQKQKQQKKKEQGGRQVVRQRDRERERIPRKPVKEKRIPLLPLSRCAARDVLKPPLTTSWDQLSSQRASVKITFPKKNQEDETLPTCVHRR